MENRIKMSSADEEMKALIASVRYTTVGWTVKPPSEFNNTTVMIEIHNKYCRTRNFRIRW